MQFTNLKVEGKYDYWLQLKLSYPAKSSRHTDTTKTFCVDLKINCNFTAWSKKTSRSAKLVNTAVNRRKKCNYLEMIIDYLTREAFNIDMIDCIDILKEYFVIK